MRNLILVSLLYACSMTVEKVQDDDFDTGSTNRPTPSNTSPQSPDNWGSYALVNLPNLCESYSLGCPSIPTGDMKVVTLKLNNLIQFNSEKNNLVKFETALDSGAGLNSGFCDLYEATSLTGCVNQWVPYKAPFTIRALVLNCTKEEKDCRNSTNYIAYSEIKKFSIVNSDYTNSGVTTLSMDLSNVLGNPVSGGAGGKSSDAKATATGSIRLHLNHSNPDSIAAHSLIRLELFQSKEFKRKAELSKSILSDELTTKTTPGQASILISDLKPGKVFVRAYIDANNNGFWDKTEVVASTADAVEIQADFTEEIDLDLTATQP